MKKVIIGIALVFTAIVEIACATPNKDKVPQVVKETFMKKFPTAKKVDWEKESETEWEAEFKMNKMEYSANFLEDGTWKETEHEIDISEVPQVVMASLNFNFSGYEIEEAEISETSSGSVYEFEMEKGESELEVAIDDNGKVVRKENLEEEDED
ncbi:PepSY-like domain-containing protein [Nonlabens antarcticus]|uniref:PepSY-like domain-containing protein n=1 Tax=Nonlabens antarcticus TaxID=392714 RepID=UPI001891852E|nr:PepSY-like domain-containing protein [Nonlabens antarcticus]